VGGFSRPRGWRAALGSPGLKKERSGKGWVFASGFRQDVRVYETYFEGEGSLRRKRKLGPLGGKERG